MITVVVGVRLTVGLYGTIVYRPSSPAVQTVWTEVSMFILCGAALSWAACMANG
ncbi:hypothetical protein [Paenibacillus sp. FSL P4-0184]|uniref:hypothetical protein n=1 Tax=Paenibacillus sp. FSL P4-0184 TaxID=2921632 RepID=UPI0030FA9E1E